MAGSTLVSYQDSNPANAAKLLTQSQGKVSAILIIVGVAHIGNAATAIFPGSIGAGKCHDLLPICHQFIDHRCDNVHICHIHPDDIKSPSGGIPQTPCLVLGRGSSGSQVLIIDDDPKALILLRRIFDP